MARGEEFYPNSSRGVESLRHMRLMALLRDMVESEGRVKAAATLGVSFRTVVRAEESGRLTARMSHALERHLLLGGGSAAAQLRESVGELTERVGALEEELQTARRAIEDRRQAAREERAKAIRQLERRLARLESAKGAEGALETAQTEAEKPASPPLWREYRELVTEEAEPGEELVYGEATPVIVEWRRATAEYKRAVATGTALERAEARIRALELEIDLIDTHELTLPPEDVSLGSVGPAGAATAQAAFAGERAGGSQPGSAKAVAAARSDLRAVERVGGAAPPATWPPHRSKRCGSEGPIQAFRTSIRPSVRVIIDSVSGFFQCFPPRKLEGQSLTRSDQTDRAPLSRRSSIRDERTPAA